MQRLMVQEVRGTPVQGIPHEWMAYMGTVNPDLMGPARKQVEFYKGEILILLQHFIFCDGRAAFIADHKAAFVAFVPGKGVFQNPGNRLQRSRYESQIFPVQAVMALG